jgi:hypothetical protein
LLNSVIAIAGIVINVRHPSASANRFIKFLRKQVVRGNHSKRQASPNTGQVGLVGSAADHGNRQPPGIS